MPVCCTYRSVDGRGHAIACYDRPTCPEIPGLELIASRRVATCAGCFQQAARLVEEATADPPAPAENGPRQGPEQPAGPQPGARFAEGTRDPLSKWLPIVRKPSEPRPVIPPTTPFHPEGATYLAYHPELGMYEISEHVNGWCAIVWIIRTDAGKGGSPLASGPESNQLMSNPPQESINKAAAALSRANDILWQCRVAFRACEIIELDARRLFFMPQGRRRTLADSFAGDTAVFDTSGGQQDFIDTLSDIATNGTADAEDSGGIHVAGNTAFDRFRAKLLKPCVHLFLVDKVKDRANPQDTTLGVGSRVRLGAGLNGRPVETPVGVIGSSGDDLGGTIAHEIGHGLGLKHNDKDTDPAVQADDENLMKPTGGTKLQPSQCAALARSVKDVSPACP